MKTNRWLVALLVAVLERCAWKVGGGGGAGEILGVHPNTLRSRMKKLGIVRPTPKTQENAPGYRGSKAGRRASPR
jgi:hypothetical protein